MELLEPLLPFEACAHTCRATAAGPACILPTGSLCRSGCCNLRSAAKLRIGLHACPRGRMRGERPAQHGD